MTDIVERLRNRERLCLDGIRPLVMACEDAATEIARLRRENEALVERVRVCSGALTPVSENEKRGMDRVLAILDRKIAEGGGLVSSDAAAVEQHNAHYRARWSAFSECATMLRAALRSATETKDESNG